MLRRREISDAKAAKAYYAHSDYYLETAGEWLGGFADELGLKGKAEQRDFDAVCDNIHPRTGGRLTARQKDNRRVGWDFNFNASKSVSVAREIVGLYDPAAGQAIEDAHREAVAFAAAFMEKDIACRVRVDGKDENRVTGNGLFMRVTHRTTRPNQDDLTPDPEIHDHLVLINATYDKHEQKTKAIQNEWLCRFTPYYEAVYHNRLAANLKELGYGVRRKGKGFELAGFTDDLVDKYSRRKKAIEEKARELGITSPEALDKLGATTRLSKSEGMTEDLPGYWDGKLADAEREAILNLKGHNSYTSDAEQSVGYAMAHEFKRKSVVDARRVYETAMRHGIGSVTPEEVEAEARRQGLIVKPDGMATTKALLRQESTVVNFGREGRGRWQPLAAGGKPVSLEGLSDEQQQAVRHIWRSSDSVILIEGDAGTGKTEAMKVTIPGMEHRSGVFLAPSASASRGTLREKGFENADTIARFLADETFRQQAKGGYIYVDEAPLAGMDDMAQVFAYAKELGARVILQGDRKQHASVNRGGAMTLLEKFAGCPVARLSEIWRQTHAGYKQAVAAIAKGEVAGGFDRLDAMGWIVQTPEEGRNTPLVDEYVKALADQASVLVVAPTHAQGDEITQAIRDRLKEIGLVGKEEKTFATLKPLAWTEAEIGDIEHRRTGGEVVQFVRNSGKYRAGQRVPASELAADAFKPQHAAVYQPGEISLATGDAIRITANGHDQSGKHKLNNGAIYRVAGFTRQGEITLQNGWVLARDFGHFTHGRVVTSHASQGMTVDRVLIAMGEESLPAINREQFYVSVSRGRQRAMVFTDLAAERLREAVQRADERITATEFMQDEPAAAKPKPADAMRALQERVRTTYWHLQRIADYGLGNPGPQPVREMGYER